MTKCKVGLGALHNLTGLTLCLVSTVALAEDRQLPVGSKPAGALVTLDGQEVGTTPMTVTVPPGDKHVLTVTQPGFSKFSKVLAKLKPTDKLEVVLVDVELAAAKAKRVKAQARYDKANAKLEAMQAAVEARVEPTPKMLRDLDDADVAMQREAERLEAVEADVRRIESGRQTDAERAENARKLREAKNAPPPPRDDPTTIGPGSKVGPKPLSMPSAELTVVCSYDEKGVGDNFTIHSYCTQGPLSVAKSTCDIRAAAKGGARCSCVEDKALVASRCR